MNNFFKRTSALLLGAVIAAASSAASPALLQTRAAGQPVSSDISDEIGLAANLFTVDGTSEANHGALQWASTLSANSYTLYRSTSPDSGFVPVYSGTGTSWEDDDMVMGNTYYYQLKVSGKTEKYSSVKELTPCALPSGLSTYDNQKGSSLVYASSGTKVGSKYYSWSLKSHPGSNDIYLAESVSDDGHNFGQERNAADSSQNSALSSCKIESVHIEYVPSANKVVVWAHWEKPSGYSDGKALVITGTPGGEFTVHHVYNPLDIEVRDMAIFFDDDSDHTGYLIAAANKPGQGANATMYIFRMTPDYSGVDKIVQTLYEDQYREFPNLIKRDGYYFLFTSQAAGWYPSSGAYSVTRDIAGKWSELRSIGNSSTFSSQSGWIVNMQDKNYLMHAYRWLRGSGTSGTTLCPLYFDNGFAFYDYYPYFKYNTSTGELFPVQKGQLLSQDKPASSSLAAKYENSPQKAVDGSYQTSFTAIGDYKKWPFYLQVDLKEVCKLSNIQTSWYICKGSEGYYTYTVEGSLDGVKWDVLLDHTDKSDEKVSKTYGFNSDMLSGKARYVRLNVKGATLQNNPNNNWYTPQIYEMKIYGSPTGEKTSSPKPAVSYDFSQMNGRTIPDITGNGGDLRLFGDAAVMEDMTGNKLLRLDGADGTYAQLPDGLLDGCSEYTVVMDAKSNSEGDFFTFAVGQDKEKYAFFRIAKDHFRFAASTDSWRDESEMKYELTGNQRHRYVFTVSGGTAKLYVDGDMVSEITDVHTLAADLGSNTIGYIGKSFYEDDYYFNGYIDNLSIYRQALNEDEAAELFVKTEPANGDLNGDEAVNSADLVLLSRHLLGMDSISGGDINNDGRTDAFDLVLLRKLVINA